ncbi:hypothetical protein D3C77_196330 [compost metagenome]
MSEIDFEATVRTLTDLSTIAQSIQVTLERNQRIRSHRRRRLLADYQVLVQMSQPADAILLDQAQQQIEFQCLLAGLTESTQVNDLLSTQQPMPRHQIRAATQQVQIATGAYDTEQASVTITLNFVGTDRLARLGT